MDFHNLMLTNNNLNADFNKYGIDYYFVWGTSNNQALLSKYQEVNNDNISNLRIYKIKT
jgi:hypothetical protein